ncbi:MAG: 3'(2'),5'-bisphosphate nucleotidase CysQ family protein, partial [Pyrinomonadaceae bacterium]
GLLSEESVDTDQRLSKNRVWMIDPLDGTSGFIEGNGDFAVQIGLVIEGQVVLGVVYQPCSDICHWAVRGNGTWRSENGGMPIREFTSSETDQNSLRLAATRSHRGKAMSRIVEALGYKEIARGSVGVKISLLVDRLCDLYIHPFSRTKQWDTCAPEAILREAGGSISDCYGQPLLYNTVDVTHRNGILASNGSAHDIVLKRLAPLMSELGLNRR